MKKLLSISMVFVTMVFFSNLPFASASPDCSKYIKMGGYCTDYVKSKVKPKNAPSGDAKTWPNNVSKKDVKKGDAAIFKSVGSYGHVAYVEKVNLDKKKNPTSVDISEMNWGGKPPMMLSDYALRVSCGVTDKFGVVSKRTVSINDVSGFWR